MTFLVGQLDRNTIHSKNFLVLFELVETIQATKIISLPRLILDILDTVAD